MKPKRWPGKLSFRSSFSRRSRPRKPRRLSYGARVKSPFSGPFPNSRSLCDSRAAFPSTKIRILNSNSMTPAFFLRLTSSALALGAVITLSTGCGRVTAQQRPAPPSVTVAPVEEKEIVEWAEFTGRTESVESVEVRPRVSGYIQNVRFQSGQLVKKGDVLFIIDPRWHQAEFDRRQAEAQRANVQLENAR